MREVRVIELNYRPAVARLDFGGSPLSECEVILAMATVTAASLESCCRTRRELANQFAIAARLYAEAVVMLTSASPQQNYSHLRDKAHEAQRRAETIRVAFEEHVDSHCGVRTNG